jgi:hypothetical protein
VINPGPSGTLIKILESNIYKNNALNRDLKIQVEVFWAVTLCSPRNMGILVLHYTVLQSRSHGFGWPNNKHISKSSVTLIPKMYFSRLDIREFVNSIITSFSASCYSIGTMANLGACSWLVSTVQRFLLASVY